MDNIIIKKILRDSIRYLMFQGCPQESSDFSVFKLLELYVQDKWPSIVLCSLLYFGTLIYGPAFFRTVFDELKVQFLSGGLKKRIVKDLARRPEILTYIHHAKLNLAIPEQMQRLVGHGQQRPSLFYKHQLKTFLSLKSDIEEAVAPQPYRYP